MREDRDRVTVRVEHDEEHELYSRTLPCSNHLFIKVLFRFFAERLQYLFSRRLFFTVYCTRIDHSLFVGLELINMEETQSLLEDNFLFKELFRETFYDCIVKD